MCCAATKQARVERATELDRGVLGLRHYLSQRDKFYLVAARQFNRYSPVALRLLSISMTSSYSTVRPELKATRQLLVRFGHAPSVKLTLEPRPAPAPAQNSRVLRLAKQSPFEAR